MSNCVDFRKLALDLRGQLTAAQSELSALREELAGRNAAIELKHRDLIEAQTAVTGWATKCKAAEQRNATLTNLLREGLEESGPEDDWIDRVIEVLRDQPNESGASE